MARIHSVTILELGNDEVFHRVLDRVIDADVLMRADRSTQKAAGANAGQAGGVSSGYGTAASGISGSIIPTLTRQAQGQGVGLTPEQKNAALVSGAEAVGGVNSGLTGEANLASARTKNAGGFSAALDEAARQKARQLATVGQNVTNLNTQIGNEQQQAALKGLEGLYGTDVNAQLRAEQQQNEDLNTQLAAGRQGWLQNTMGTIGALGELGSGVGAAKKAWS